MSKAFIQKFNLFFLPLRLEGVDSVGHSAEKFNVISNDHGRTVQKIKIVSLCSNLLPTLSQICRIQWWCSLLLFLTGIPFLGEFGS